MPVLLKAKGYEDKFIFLEDVKTLKEFLKEIEFELPKPHLFTEISPPIPKEYEHHFMVHGTLLPGYTVEGLEQAKTEHAAAEVSEGGIFTPENQEKPSVLGKLSVAKTQR